MRFSSNAPLNHDVRLRANRRELGICAAVISSKDSYLEVPMNEAGNPAQECPDQGVRYILLAIEAEILSEQSVSPYLREASHRLSQFWLARAAAARNDENMPQEFHAPTRN